MAFPRQPEQITSEFVSSALAKDVDVSGIEQIGIGVGILGRLFRVSLDDGSSVVAKIPTLDQGARMNVVAPLNFYEKEVRFYSEVARDLQIATPKVHFAEFDQESGDFALLLEDMGGRCRMADQVTGCEVKDAEVAVDALAALHAQFWQSDRLGSMSWLPEYSDPPYPLVIAGMYMQSWPVALEVLGDHLPSDIREFGERYAELVPWFLDEATHLPHSLVHGDFRLDNLFFGALGDDAPITVVDWQLCFKGRPGFDLAYFISQSLTTEDRRASEPALIDRYKEGLSKRGVDYPEDDLDRDYRRTVAFCFIYPVVAAGQIEVTNERHLALIQGMADRAIQAMRDSRALDLVPA